jgi:2-polyprenyl-3-methyl-5-hydroxy-6-metoxy-1,4-benzoquinol methylase
MSNACVNCGSADQHPYLDLPQLNFSQRITSGRIFRCGCCDTYALDPMPTTEDIAELYAVQQRFSQPTAVGTASNHVLEKLYRHWGRDYRFMALRSLSHLPDRKPLAVIDIGCSTGRLLEQFKMHAPEADLIGIDIDPGAKARAPRHLMDNIKIAEFDDVDFGSRRYDIITLAFVIEHMPDVQHMLHGAAKLLAPSGVLMISTPDITSPIAKAFGAQWSLISQNVPIGHCVWYTEKSLRSIGERAGLRCIEMRRRCGVLYSLPRPLRRALEISLGGDANKNRFISNYTARMLWASLIDGKLSESLNVGHNLYGFFTQ